MNDKREMPNLLLIILHDLHVCSLICRRQICRYISVQLGLGVAGSELSEKRLAAIAEQARIFQPGRAPPGAHTCAHKSKVRSTHPLIATVACSQSAQSAAVTRPVMRPDRLVEVDGGQWLCLLLR